MLKNLFHSSKKYAFVMGLGLILFLIGLFMVLNGSSDNFKTLAQLLIYFGLFLLLGYPLSQVLERHATDTSPKKLNDERNKLMTQASALKTIQSIIPVMLIFTFTFIDNTQLVIVLLSILVLIVISLFGWKKYYESTM